LKTEEIRDNIETILRKNILPEFQNTFGPIRAMAAECFGKYGHIKFNNEWIIEKAYIGILKCIKEKILQVNKK
jgi:hypothetical protein